MNLSKTERLILMNQFKILQKIDNNNKLKHIENFEIIKYGYEREYNNLLNETFELDKLSESDCNEVINILNMYTWLIQTWINLPEEEKKEILKEKILYPGIDSQEKPEKCYYSKFCLKTLNRFSFIQEHSKNPDFESHYCNYKKLLEMLQTYQNKNKTNEKEIFYKLIEMN